MKNNNTSQQVTKKDYTILHNGFQNYCLWSVTPCYQGCALPLSYGGLIKKQYIYIAF